VINASITLTQNRSSLDQFTVEEREQNFRNKREQFRKFYDNREQSMKAYVIEKSQKNENNVLNQNESFEDIDSAEENDEEDQDEQFVYNLNINSLEVCKKCDEKRETFKFNNVFHIHIRDCIDDETKIKITSKQYSQNLSLIKSRVKDTIHKSYDFRSYQYAIV
jgi:superfamily II helicase